MYICIYTLKKRKTHSYIHLFLFAIRSSDKHICNLLTNTNLHTEYRVYTHIPVNRYSERHMVAHKHIYIKCIYSKNQTQNFAHACGHIRVHRTSSKQMYTYMFVKNLITHNQTHKNS